jgi:hypothetical protein
LTARASARIVRGVVPIPFAPLLGFVLGVVLAWVSREELARDDGPLIASRPVAVASAFALAVYAPMVGYFVAFHADWSYLYLYPRAVIPSAVDLALVLFAAAQVPLGVMVSAPAAHQRRLGAIVWFVSVPSVLAAALFAWSARRLAVSASYAQFHGGFGTVSISASALGRGVLFMAGVCALGVVWSLWVLGAWSVSPGRPRSRPG